LSTAIWTSKHIHGIPYEDFELGEKDYHKLWQELIDFISDACDNSPPIIYAKVGVFIELSFPFFKVLTILLKGTKMEKSCLAWLAAKAGRHTQCFYSSFTY